MLKEIEERWSKATPGEWNIGPDTLMGNVWVYVGHSPLMEPLTWRCRAFALAKKWGRAIGLIRPCDVFQRRGENNKDYRRRCDDACRSNATAIAHAPTDIAWLIKELKQMDKHLDRMAGELVDAKGE